VARPEPVPGIRAHGQGLRRGDQGLPILDAPALPQDLAAEVRAGGLVAVGDLAPHGAGAKAGLAAEEGHFMGVALVVEDGPHGQGPGFQVGIARRRLVLGDDHVLLGPVPLHLLAKELGDIADGDVGAVVLGVGGHVHLEMLPVAEGFGAVQGHDKGIPRPPDGDPPGGGVIVHRGPHQLGQAAHGHHGALIAHLGNGGVQVVCAHPHRLGVDDLPVQGNKKERFGGRQVPGRHAVGRAPIQHLGHGEPGIREQILHRPHKTAQAPALQAVGQVLVPEPGPGVPEVGQSAGGRLAGRAIGGTFKVGPDFRRLPFGGGVEGIFHLQKAYLEVHTGPAHPFQLPQAVEEHRVRAGLGLRIPRPGVLPEGENFVSGCRLIGRAVREDSVLLRRTPRGRRGNHRFHSPGGRAEGQSQCRTKGNKMVFLTRLSSSYSSKI